LKGYDSKLLAAKLRVDNNEGVGNTIWDRVVYLLREEDENGGSWPAEKCKTRHASLTQGGGYRNHVQQNVDAWRRK